jgi:hypothetical protein
LPSPREGERRLLDIWEKNTLMYPPEFNAEYDVMDRNQTLKNLLQIIEEIQQQAQQQPTSASNAMSPASNFHPSGADFGGAIGR